MKVGFFGGSFDPIHFGHLNLAIQLMEIEKLDEVVFSPVWCSPFKEHTPPIASGEDRWEMIRLAIEDLASFRVTDYEIRKQTPSYTIEALHHFCKGSPASFYLLLSEEAAFRFFEWKEAEEVMRMAFPLIGARANSLEVQKLPQPLQAGVRRTKSFEISSTEIRERLRQGLYCGHLMPEKTLSFIQKQGLYQ